MMPTPFHNSDCIEGAKKFLGDDSVDLIITDPPYGIAGDTLHRHYHRDEQRVLDGYVEVPPDAYPEFSRRWIEQAARVLRPGGSIYIVSGYTNLRHVLNALAATPLREVNHIIWKYNFGVYTRKKYVSAHYHILYYVKPGGAPTFNTNCRFGPLAKGADGGALNYLDREDVWLINREYKPGETKNKNELPAELLKKMILYSSNPGDLVCDFFLGGFSTAKTAIGLGRRACGFELSRTAFEHHLGEIAGVAPGSLLTAEDVPPEAAPSNQGRRWTEREKSELAARYRALLPELKTKQRTIAALCAEFGRGRFAILNALDGLESSRAAAPPRRGT